MAAAALLILRHDEATPAGGNVEAQLRPLLVPLHVLADRVVALMPSYGHAVSRVLGTAHDAAAAGRA